MSRPATTLRVNFYFAPGPHPGAWQRSLLRSRRRIAALFRSMGHFFQFLQTLVRLAQPRSQLDLVDHALAEIFEHPHLVIRPGVRLTVDYAERPQRVARDHQRHAGVGNDLQIANGWIVAVLRILPGISNDERFLERNGVFAKGMAEGGLTLRLPGLWQPDRALEELPLAVDDRHERDGRFEH